MRIERSLDELLQIDVSPLVLYYVGLGYNSMDARHNSPHI